MKIKTKLTALAVAISAQLMPIGNLAIAQEESVDKEQEFELIMVTGSFVRRSENYESPSPMAVINSVNIDSIGAKSIADITQSLTINTGSENNPDAFTQNATAGTSNINLRGLGVASTLVLLNNKRQVVNSQQTNEGLNFVDTSSLVPMIAIDRMEVIKDGASALYGSDAVAGVVNFITKRNYEGAKLSFDYQDGAHGDNSEYNLQGLWGAVGDNGSVMGALSYTNRSPLFLSDRRLSRPQDDSSNLGNPGSFFGAPGVPAGVPVIDPTGCAEFGGIVNDLGVGIPGVGLCQFDFGPGYSYVPTETRLNVYFRSTYDFDNDISWTSEISIARNRAERGGAPSFPILTGPVVPASHPDNVFGAPVVFFGRAEGNGFEADPANTESDTFRFNTMLTGELDDGFWEISYTNASNDFSFKVEDVIKDKFTLALNGLGGRGCDPISGTPGEGLCEYFNPFATSFTTSPNTQNVIDSFSGEQAIDSNSDLEVLEGFASINVFEMNGGTAGLAFGAQYRKEQLSQDYDALSNEDSFTFLIGNPDFKDSLDVIAAFAELALPVTDTLDVQLALRYEDYGGTIGDTLDHKIAFNYRATEDFSIRASLSSSFRAPSVFMRNGGATSLQQLSDPLIGGGNAFAAVRTSGNADLTPEESDAYNIGFSLEPLEDWSVEVDYWNFDFKNLIIQENAQAILNLDPSDTTRLIRAGNPETGPLVGVRNTFVNASSLTTSGIDFVTSYEIDTDGAGTFTPNITMTYIAKYDLDDPQAGKIDGAGRRNFSNIGVSSPELRTNFGLGWQMEAYSANLFARYVSSYDDDQNCTDGVCLEVDSHITYDAQFNVNLSALFDMETDYVLTVGGVNITDEDPPQVITNSGFDSKVHDPRGRQLYARIAIEF
jgi:outer membrane receptor protein involved in Fe transport